MEDTTELMNYFKKLQKSIEKADFRVLKYKFVKKSRIDDLLVCTLAVLPDSFKKTMKKRLKLDMFPSVSCDNRLSKIIKKTFFLTPDYYMIDFGEALSLLKNIIKYLESDLRKLEEQLGGTE